jgi:hypothetical protein
VGGHLRAKNQFSETGMRSLARYRYSLGSLHPDLAQFVTDVDTALTQLQSSSGQNLDPPAQCILGVTGVDGKFIIAVTPPENILPYTAQQMIMQNQAGPNANGIALLHQLQSATDINFNNQSNITDYGVSSQLSWTFQLPNQTLFWRLRSSFDGQNWNEWQLYSTAGQCGPVSVSSGQMRSTSIVPNSQLNTLNFATVDSIDAGASATIRVYGTGGVGTAWTRQVGAVNDLYGPFPSASLTGFAYTTAYYVYYDLDALIYRVFLTSQLPQTLPDTFRWAGKVTTVAAGGGGGTGGGGGAGGGSGGCVEIETPVEVPSGTTEEIIACAEWVVVKLADREAVAMHPDTLVSVFKRAIELTPNDRIEVENAQWRNPQHLRYENRDSKKVKRVCPGGIYSARGIRLHNYKPNIL